MCRRPIFSKDVLSRRIFNLRSVFIFRKPNTRPKVALAHDHEVKTATATFIFNNLKNIGKQNNGNGKQTTQHKHRRRMNWNERTYKKILIECIDKEFIKKSKKYHKQPVSICQPLLFRSFYSSLWFQVDLNHNTVDHRLHTLD